MPQDGASRRFSLPAWLDHFNLRDLKVVFRCWAAVWVSSILMFIGPSLHSIGLATFFAPLVLYLFLPAGVLFAYLFGALTLLGGMCLAWAWGLLTMVAAQAARPDWQTRARLQELQHQAVVDAHQSGKSVSWNINKLIRQGFMLDARITVVFYVLGCIFVYVMARLRVANAKFAAAETFGNIVTDLFILYGPPLPTFTPLLGKILVEPGAIGIGLGAACCVLFFPQSTSHAVLEKMEQLVRMGGASLQCTRARLARKPTDLAQLRSVRAKTIGVFKAVQPMLAFLPLDLSRCRWSANDIRGLVDPVRQVMIAQLALLDFHISQMEVEQKLSDIPSDQEHANGESIAEKPHREIGHHQLHESATMMAALKSPEAGAVRLQTTEALEESTAGLLEVYSDCIGVITECIRIVNANRWFGHTSTEQSDQLVTRGENIIDRLHSAKDACVTETTKRLIECHGDLFDDGGKLKGAENLGPHALRSLVRGMVIEERILASATATEDLLARVLQLLKKRTHNRIWFPPGIRQAVSWLFRHREAPLPGISLTASDISDPDIVQQQANEAYRKLQISRGQGSGRRQGFLSRAIRYSYHWLTNPGGMYALRMVVVTIATSIPASLPSTAGFYYREKGIWGVITAQIAVLVYMADFALSFLGRAVGTIIGGVIGLVAWYIGSGHGLGNAYGLSAITAAATLILVWLRLFLPHTITGPAVMSGVTFVLVMGFSYDDGHLQQYGLPGHGYQAFYKRVVTVLLGLVAALVVQIFPRPPSAGRHIRKTLSNIIRNLSDHYALLLSTWNRTSASRVDVVAEEISLNLAESLLSLQQPIHLLKLEISLDPFDQHTLHRVQELCQVMNQALGRLLGLSGTLPAHLQERLVRTMGILDGQTIGAVMAVLGVAEQALKSGDPLPERLQTPLVRRSYEAWHAQHWSAELSTELIGNENYRAYCVAVSSYLKFLSAIDDLMLVLKGALGESHIVDRWEGGSLA